MFKNAKKDSLILLGIGYFIFIFFILHIVTCFNKIQSFDISKLNMLSDMIINNIETSPFNIELGDKSIKAFLIGSAAYVVASLYYLTTRKKFMNGQEYGSAEWGNREDSKKLLGKKIVKI